MRSGSFLNRVANLIGNHIGLLEFASRELLGCENETQ